MWDIKTREVLGTKYPANGALEDLKFSEDGQELIALLSNGECTKINVETLNEEPIAKHDQDSYVMNVSGDGSWVASSGLSGQLHLTDINTGHTRTVGHHGISINGICFDAAARRVACGGFNRVVTFYDLPSGRRSFELRDQSRIRQCEFFPGTEDRFISSSDQHLRIWDLVKRRPVLSITMDDGLTNFAVHPTGDLLSVGRRDGNIRFWERHRPTPEQVRDRRLQKHAMLQVEKAFRNQMWAADVVAEIEELDMAPRVKSMALSYLQARGDQFDLIVRQVEETVDDPSKDPETYNDTLIAAERILKQVEDAPQCESLLGMALFRAGRRADAVETLREAKAMLEQIPLMPNESYASNHRSQLLLQRATNLAFLAMALEQANRKSEASDALSELKADSELFSSMFPQLADEVKQLESRLHGGN